jgi:hypothetical protein
MKGLVAGLLIVFVLGATVPAISQTAPDGPDFRLNFAKGVVDTWVAATQQFDEAYRLDAAGTFRYAGETYYLWKNVSDLWHSWDRGSRCLQHVPLGILIHRVFDLLFGPASLLKTCDTGTSASMERPSDASSSSLTPEFVAHLNYVLGTVDTWSAAASILGSTAPVSFPALRSSWMRGTDCLRRTPIEALTRRMIELSLTPTDLLHTCVD